MSLKFNDRPYFLSFQLLLYVHFTVLYLSILRNNVNIFSIILLPYCHYNIMNDEQSYMAENLRLHA